MPPKIKILIFCLSALLFIGCDRVTKDLAKAHLMNKPSISYLHNSFQLVYVENTGAAMSLGDGLPRMASFWLLSMLPLIFLLCLAAYTISHAKEFLFVKLISFALKQAVKFSSAACYCHPFYCFLACSLQNVD